MGLANMECLDQPAMPAYKWSVFKVLRLGLFRFPYFSDKDHHHSSPRDHHLYYYNRGNNDHYKATNDHYKATDYYRGTNDHD